MNKVTGMVREYAEAGDAKYQRLLGLSYYYGDGVKKDYAAAAEWLKKAADQGDTAACFNLGLMNLGGHMPENYGEAARLFRQSAEAEDCASQYLLAEMCRTGTGVEPDFAEAVKWHRQAAVNGFRASEFILELLHGCGTGPVQRKLWDFNLSMDLFSGYFKHIRKHLESAAKSGDADAAYCLGYCYMKNCIVRVNYKKGVMWYTAAAEKGDFVAQTRLGAMYCAIGAGVQYDPKKGAELYRQAAETGSADAMAGLAECYEGGNGVERSLDMAEAWYKKAAEQYRKSAEAGDPDACYSLAMLYLNGKGVEKDMHLAREWCRKAAECGNLAVLAEIRGDIRYGVDFELRRILNSE